jgi:RNA-directed DNA polymerase
VAKTLARPRAKGAVSLDLYQSLYSIDNMRAAFWQVKKNRGGPGIDGVTIKMFEDDLERNLLQFYEELPNGTYAPQPVKRILIHEPSGKKRPLGIPSVRDRVVQAALLQVLGPVFEPHFSEHSYGFRPGRGPKDAVKHVIRLLEAGYLHVLDADIASFFDTIPPKPLLGLIERRCCDANIIRLIEAFLAAGYLEHGKRWSQELGTPQGAVISPLLANIYLNPLDHLANAKEFEMVRYADDFVIPCRTREEAERALEVIDRWLHGVGLSLNQDKTGIINASHVQGFNFLGYHITQDELAPREEKLAQAKEKIWEKTRRSRKETLGEIVDDLNRYLCGWYQHFSLSTNLEPFVGLDEYVKARLGPRMRRPGVRNWLKKPQSHKLRLFAMAECHWTGKTVYTPLREIAPWFVHEHHLSG